MDSFVEMYHEELDAIMQCPVAAVSTYEDRGWIRVTAIEPPIPSDKEILLEGDEEEADDELQSSDEEETSNQEGY